MIIRFQEFQFTEKSLYQIHYSKNESKNIKYSLEYDWLIRGIDNQESRLKLFMSYIFNIYFNNYYYY